jgi:hypothetical protein
MASPVVYTDSGLTDRTRRLSAFASSSCSAIQLPTRAASGIGPVTTVFITSTPRCAFDLFLVCLSKISIFSFYLMKL